MMGHCEFELGSGDFRVLAQVIVHLRSGGLCCHGDNRKHVVKHSGTNVVIRNNTNLLFYIENRAVVPICPSLEFVALKRCHLTSACAPIIFTRAARRLNRKTDVVLGAVDLNHWLFLLGGQSKEFMVFCLFFL